MTDFVELQRRFQTLTDAELPDSDHLAAMSEARFGLSHGWPELLTCRRVVLLAEAGSGKTRELRAQARRLIDGGSFAFFIRLEWLDGDLRSGLQDVADENRFDAWKTDQSAPAWFFLDAVDELKLTGRRLEQALRDVARGVDGHLGRARCIVSCRPSDWRPDHDLNSIQSVLPVPQDSERARATASAPEGMEGAGSTVERERMIGGEEKNSSEDHAVRRVLMLPLRDTQIRLFARQRGLVDADAFMDAIEAEEAWTFARRPLDLIQLMAVWERSRRLGTRQEQQETNVTVKLAEEDPDRRDGDVLSWQKARSGAERLALALALTRTRTLRSPEQSLGEQPGDDILEPASILQDWNVAERRALLRKGLFDPATYGRVRFHHRSVQEYLAACRLRLLRGSRMSPKAVFRLLFANVHGVAIVFPSMREIAAWLSLWDSDVRKELMRREPEVLLTLGDPGSLDLGARSDLVRAFTGAYRDGGWRGLHVPVREIRRIADPSLAPVVRQCWGDGTAGADVREFLLELIRMGPIRDCADLAMSVATDSEALPDHRVIAIQALLRCCRHDDVRALATRMVADPTSWPARVIHGVAEDLFPSIIGVDQLIKLIEQTPEPPRFQLGGFEWRLRQMAGSIEPLSDVAVTLRDRLADLIWQGRAEPLRPHRASGRFAYLAPALAKLCVHQLTTGMTAPPSKLIHACVIASRFGEHVTDADKSIATLRVRFRADGKWRAEAFWAELAFVDRIVSDDNWFRSFRASRNGLTGPLTEADRFWLSTALADRNRPERRAVALHALIDLWRHAGSAEVELADIRNRVEDDRHLVAILEQQTLPPTSEQEARWAENDAAERQQREEEAREQERWREAEEELRRELRTRPDEAFSSENRDATLYRLYAWLRTRPGIDGPPEHWNTRAFAEAFGQDTAERAEAALKAFWRSTPPVLWSAKPPEERDRVFWESLLGLAAVKIEASINGWAASLTSGDARTAAAFATTELSGPASFVTDLARSHPRETEEVIGGEVSGELRVGGSHDHLRTLQSLTYAARELQQLCAPRLLAALQSWPSAYVDGTGACWAGHLDAVLQILRVVEDVADRELIARQCVDRYTSDPSGPLAFTWLRGLFRFDAAQGISVLAAQFSENPTDDVDENAVGALAALLDRHEGLVFGNSELDGHARALGRLVRLAYTFVRPEDDIVHDGVYSPGARDHAETVRQRLLEMLFACPEPEAHRVLHELADDACFGPWSDRFRLRVRQRAAEQAEFSPYTSDDIVALERHLEAPPCDRDSLFAVMMDRLEELAYELAHGDFSDRRTICSISEEREMQRTLAGRLRDRANGAYQVTREEQVVRGKETDIRLRCSNGDQKAAVEVKIADSRWSLTQLRDALRTQLVGRYLRDATCKAGCLLLTCHDKEKYWIHPETGKRIRFPELIEYLNDQSKIVEAEEHYEVRTAVFGLDLTDP